MKKLITIMSIILCLCLCSCSATHAPGTSDVSSQDDPTTPLLSPLRYDSLIDLRNAISQKNEDTLYAKFTQEGASSDQINKLKFFVEKLQSHNVTAPYLDGKAINFRNEEGFSNISLFASEAHGLPCIFYHPYVSTGENFYITITYLPDEIFKTQQKITASNVIKELSPKYGNINNLGDQHKAIYNQQLTLSDRQVTALVYEYKTDSRNSYHFVYDDLLVLVRCDPTVWDAQWFAQLSFQ